MAGGYLDKAVLAVTNGAGQELGSCFRAPILDSSRFGAYLITTGHSLLADARRGGQVTVMDRDGARYNADVMVCAEAAEPDVGLLYTNQPVGQLVECISPPTAGEVLIRSALSGLDTSFGTLRGEHHGLESLDGGQLMAVALKDLGFLEPPESGGHVRSLAYGVLRGMSGAPVCRTAGGKVLVYGMVVRRNTGGISNRVYALPVDVMRQFLSQHGFPLRVSQRLDSTTQATNLLVGRLISRLVDYPGGLHQLWVDTSGLFYSGIPIDAVLQDALRQPERFGLAELQAAEVEFLLARLLFKRGDDRSGLTLLRHAHGLAGRGSTTEHRHLAALIDLRMMLWSARDLSADKRRLLFERSVGTYEQLQGAPDDERAYEVASAVGSEANQLASDDGFLRRDDSTRRQFSRLLTKHTGLLTTYPQMLREKQEVVNLGLSAVKIMWNLDETRDPNEQSDALAALASQGRLAAIQRDNGIFYAQMLLADAIAARLNGQPYRAFALTSLVGAILSSSHLRLSHEGVRSYLSFIDEHDGVLADLLRAAHATDLSDVPTVLSNLDLSSQAERSALTAALDWCQSINAGGMSVSEAVELESLIQDL